ncbi:Beta-lactamase [Catenulispora acidiphila DSM 44928]|uniref:Beta-lactamase n=1 Tax=Catenulispora acidiphila (strain DSM 44928 / JCM 14897 / NBRC 102108 / NRRL B-24433 / ID139908) TaxID=479433 RepID=C7Q6I7_CATAD|nr:class A beta-lactamase [Catenulispora acidiphila]ACU74022.1 Beta-lactamase [Catenulispora acidiphila DSM 44928]
MRRFTERIVVRTVSVAASLALVAAALGGCSSASNAPTSSVPSASSTSSTPAASSAASTSASTDTDSAAFAQIAAHYQAQLGVYAVDTGSGRTVGYQADQRFAFCSTIKALAAAELLHRDTDAQLAQTIHYSASDLVDYSPVTSQHVNDGMTLTAVMTAAIEVSDNTALNLMLDRLGGPAGLQTALRGMNDATTDADRPEPAVNSAVPGDVRDTSTPRAMAEDLRAYVLGNALSPQRRALLTSWLTANTTGGPYIRAAVPAGWTVGDKTGNGDYGTRNDIAVLWPPHRAPIVIAVLSHRDGKDATSADALIADATKVALQQLG